MADGQVLGVTQAALASPLKFGGAISVRIYRSRSLSVGEDRITPPHRRRRGSDRHHPARSRPCSCLLMVAFLSAGLLAQ